MSSKGQILVVEDDPLVCEVISGALEDRFTTSIAETSAAALQRLGKGGIGMILLDCTLPDGVDPELFSLADRAGVPIVLMSGDPRRMDGLSTQARPFILKPFTLTDLVTTLEAATGGAGSAAA